VVNDIGEGPLWCSQEQALYWVDAGQTPKTLLRHSPVTGKTDVIALPQRAASVIRRNGEGVILGLQKGLAVLSPTSGGIRLLSLNGVDFDRERFNDSAVDRAGRLWIGTFDRTLQKPLGCLYCVDGSLQAHKMDEGFMMSNGIAWSPDNRTMYFCDSRPGKIFAYDFDLTAGRVSNRRIFMDFSERAGRPDGCAIDSEGFLWVAEIDASQILKIAPDGDIESILPVPIRRPTSVAFGGERLETLFITSMTFGLKEHERREQPYAGRLLAVDVGIKGVEEPAFNLTETERQDTMGATT